MPNSLEAATKELAVAAVPGSRCSPKGQHAIEAAARALGGYWFLAQCGHFHAAHPRAGQPAKTLVQLMLLSIAMDEVVKASDKVVVRPTAINIITAPKAGDNPYLFAICYELDGNGWPTGVLVARVRYSVP